MNSISMKNELKKDSKSKGTLEAKSAFSKWKSKMEPIHNELTKKISKPDPKRIILLNPQGAVGENSVKFMNYPGTTCMGGQIPFVINLAKGIKNSTEGAKVSISSQRTGGDFKGGFNKGVEGVAERSPISLKGEYLDKEAIKNGHNQFYPKVAKWGQDLVANKLNKKMPGGVILSYWDSYVAYSNMVKQWKSEGAKQLPRAVAIPHSLGYRKLVSMFTENVKKAVKNPEIASRLSNASGKGERQQVMSKVMSKELDKLMNDQKYMFPSRVLSERLMFSSPFVKGCLNSQSELDKQLLASPYTIEFGGLKSVSDNLDNIKVINPGIDTDKFGLNKNKEMLAHEKHAAEFLKERLEKDIAPERRHLPMILALGRLNKDKNFHGLANAFKNDPELMKKANLVFVVNGSDRSLNVNYMKEMTNLIEKTSKKDVMDGNVKLDSFEGSALEQLVNLSEITNDKKMDGKWTTMSLPNGNDYAGLQRHLGQDSKAVGGLYSFQEPYGLAPFETANCGIPVVVSNGSGAAKELVAAGAKSFTPTESKEIAESLKSTLNNLDKIRSSQMEYANSKGWTETAKSYMKFLNRDESKGYDKSEDVDIKAVEPDSKTFVDTGKKLIVEAIKKDIKDGKIKL